MQPDLAQQSDIAGTGSACEGVQYNHYSPPGLLGSMQPEGAIEHALRRLAVQQHPSMMMQHHHLVLQETIDCIKK